jgi:hypothetical protein
MKGEIPDRGVFESKGYLSVDKGARRVEWGQRFPGITPAAHGRRGRRGERGNGPPLVRREVGGGKIQEESSEDRDPLEEAVGATLESTRRQIGEGAGKVQSPSPAN